MRTSNRLPVLLALMALVLTAWSPARAGAATPTVATPTVAGLRVVAAPSVAGPKVAAPKVAGPKVASGFAILVDAQTGTVLWTRHATTARAPASLTKMLTALLIRASLPPNAVVVTNRDAARTPPTRLAL